MKTIKNKYIFLSIPVVFLLVSLAWYFSDKQVIKRQLTELTWNISKEAKESTLDTALKLREVKKMLAPNILAIVSERNYSESLPQDMIIRYLMYYRDRYETLAVSFTNFEIELPAKEKATVLATVLVQRKKAQNEPEQLSESVEILLKKNNEVEKGGKKWQMVQASIASSLVE
ncbi:MAG: hypothetical protein D3918_15920 [Candidatus Electrothrix sp. AX2]|nr:hypothetical protein [Candidatus Electrothrix gigas]